MKDQLTISEQIFQKEGETTVPPPEERKKILTQVLNDARSNIGLLFIGDILFPHVASNTDWIVDHPDAGYTPMNSPHLKVLLLFLLHPFLFEVIHFINNN